VNGEVAEEVGVNLGGGGMWQEEHVFLECFRASLTRPSDKGNVKVRTLRRLEAVPSEWGTGILNFRLSVKLPLVSIIFGTSAAS
jgi:hypothetical protein